MGAFFTQLFTKFAAFGQWLLAVLAQLVKDFWNFFTDIICWAFDGLLDISVSALNAISIPFDPGLYYSMVPSDVAAMLGYIKVPQAVAIIVSALLVRFLLQMIPFVRWGS